MQDNTIPLRIFSGGDPGPANPADPASGGSTLEARWWQNRPKYGKFFANFSAAKNVPFALKINCALFLDFYLNFVTFTTIRLQSNYEGHLVSPLGAASWGRQNPTFRHCLYFQCYSMCVL